MDHCQFITFCSLKYANMGRAALLIHLTPIQSFIFTRFSAIHFEGLRYYAVILDAALTPLSKHSYVMY